MPRATNVEIRESVPADRGSIESLYPRAFPDEDLLPLVRDLLAQGPQVLSLVAALNRQIEGHIAFTRCGLNGVADDAALLGPLAVAPERQRMGVGSELVLEGLRQLASSGVLDVFVLGDPAYYRRFGFRQESRVAPPYPTPVEWAGAWQSRSIGDRAVGSEATLLLPSIWLQPHLWAP